MYKLPAATMYGSAAASSAASKHGMPMKMFLPFQRSGGHHSTGIVQHIELSPANHLRWQQTECDSMFVLHHPPIILVKLDDNNQDTGLGPGIIAVEKQLCEPFYTELEVTDERCSRARLLKVRARREQIPLTIVTASTLYTLQGTTAEPGLVYYFQTPRRLSKVMTLEGWGVLAIYIRHGKHHDLTNALLQNQLLGWISSRMIAAIWLGTLCSSGSRARHDFVYADRLNSCHIGSNLMGHILPLALPPRTRSGIRVLGLLQYHSRLGLSHSLTRSHVLRLNPPLIFVVSTQHAHCVANTTGAGTSIS